MTLTPAHSLGEQSGGGQIKRVPFRDRKMRTWNMSRPVYFASSKAHAGVQLADLVSGVAPAMPNVEKEPALQPLADRVLPHLEDTCILFAPEVVDLALDEPPVNWFVLEELAYRADIGADPLFGMEAVYAHARATLPQFREWEASQKSVSLRHRPDRGGGRSPFHPT